MLVDCGSVGFSTNKCTNIENVLVARSATFSTAPYANYTNVISIENTHHFNMQVLTLQSDYFYNYVLSITSSSISFNGFSDFLLSAPPCKPQSAVLSQSTTASNKFISHSILFTDTRFDAFTCAGNAIIEVTQDYDILPIFNLINSRCTNCAIELKDLMKLPSSTT